MTLSLESFQTTPTSYATCSIGCKPEHTLPKKLDAIAAAGFQAIELSMPDILGFARLYLKKDVGPKDWDDLRTAARTIKAQTDAKGLKILMLQPFANFEGWAEGSPERKDAFDRAQGWASIMEACDCDMLQVSRRRGGLAGVPDHDTKPSRLGPPTLRSIRSALTVTASFPTSANSPTSWPRRTFESRTRTGAGRRTLQTGRMFGISSRRWIGPMSVYV